MDYRIVEIETVDTHEVFFFPQKNTYVPEGYRTYLFMEEPAEPKLKKFLFWSWEVKMTQLVKFKTKEEASKYIDDDISKRPKPWIIHDYPLKGDLK